MRPVYVDQDLDDLRASTLAYAAIASWSDLGLFEKLSDRVPRSAAELGMDPRALEITGEVMCFLQLASRSGDKWSLTARGAELQAGGVLDLPGPQRIFEPLTRLSTTLVEGTPYEQTHGGVVESDPERSRNFMEMLYRRSAESVEETARVVAPLIGQGARVLDVGGGHGRYGEAFAAHCGASVTLVDRQVCVDYARARYGDSQDYIVGDFMTADLGGPYDLALLSNIVHGMGLEAIRQLLTRLADCVVPGGLLVLKDMFFEGGGNSQAAPMFGMQMLLFTAEGKSFSVPEMREVTAATGFEGLECVAVPDCGFSLLIVRRSG